MHFPFVIKKFELQIQPENNTFLSFAQFLYITLHIFFENMIKSNMSRNCYILNNNLLKKV